MELRERADNLLQNYRDLQCYCYLLDLVLKDDQNPSGYLSSDIAQNALDMVCTFVFQHVQALKFDIRYLAELPTQNK